MPTTPTTALLIEHQIAAIKDAYDGSITDTRSLAAKYPMLSHKKQPLFSIAHALDKGLSDKKLHREVLKALKMPVPPGCYTDDEMRDAIVAYHFRAADKTTIATITDRYGPSKTRLHEQHKRLVDALALAPLGSNVTRDAVRSIAAGIEFHASGRPTLFKPDEERLLLEMVALHADHGHGKGARLQVNYAKRALEHMAEAEDDPVVKERLSGAKLSRRWLTGVRQRVEKLPGGEYKDMKPSLLSQTRAAAKKPAQNAAMFEQIQAKYDELGAAGKLPGCQRADGHYEPPPHLVYAGDEMGIEPNGKRWVRVLARKGSKLVHRIVTGEHNPFWVTLFFWSRADGGLEVPPMVIHKAAQMRGDLANGLPIQPGKQWLVRASESGYLTKDDWLLVCAHLKMHIHHRPAFLFFDGFVNHWDADALDLLITDDIYVFCLKSQDSDSDQINDNGPNASVKAGYGRHYDDWLERNPGVPFSPYYLNPLLAAAWSEFTEIGKPIIVRAAKICGISPLNPNAENFEGSAVSKTYDLVAAAKEAESPPPVELMRTETTSKLTVLQLKAASPDTTLVIRSSAASFFETSFIKPAIELQRELKHARELKKQTMPLEIDRTIPETSVGRWVTTELVASLKSNSEAKERALEDKKEKQAERDSKKARQHVELLGIGADAIEKLRVSRDACLTNDELRGAIVHLGGKAKGNKAELEKVLDALLEKKPEVLTLPAPTPSPALAAAPATAPGKVPGKAPAKRKVHEAESESESSEEEESDDSEEEGADDVYDIEAILGERGSGANRRFEVKWEGFDETTWEPASHLRNNSVYMEYIKEKNRAAGKRARA